MNARKNLFFVLPLFLLCSLHAELPIPNETADGSEDEHLFYGIWKQTLNNRTPSSTPINRSIPNTPTENLNADHTVQKEQQSKELAHKINVAIAAAFCVSLILQRITRS